MRPLSACLVAVMLLTGCHRVVRMDVQATPLTAEQAAAQPLKRFAVKPAAIEPAVVAALQQQVDQRTEAYLTLQGDRTFKPPYPITAGSQKPELQSAAIAAVKRALEARGYVHEEAAPDFIVGLAVLDGHLKYEVAPTVRQGEPFNANRPVRPDAGRWSEWPTSSHAPYTDGYSASGGHSAMTDVAGLAVQISRPADSAALWSGTAATVSTYSSFESAGESLANELLAEFPTGSGKPPERRAPVK